MKLRKSYIGQLEEKKESELTARNFLQQLIRIDKMKKLIKKLHKEKSAVTGGGSRQPTKKLADVKAQFLPRKASDVTSGDPLKQMEATGGDNLESQGAEDLVNW